MKKKVRDTRLGQWLKERAPDVLVKVGDALPDQGVLGVIKNLVGGSSDPEYLRAMNEAERAAQEAVTERWKADMSSDTKLAKLVRPITLLALLALYLGLAVCDSIESLMFEVKDAYIDLLQVLMLTAFGAYFAGRSLEKSRRDAP